MPPPRLSFARADDRVVWEAAARGVRVVVLPHSRPFLDGLWAHRAFSDSNCGVYCRWWPAWLAALAPRWCLQVGRGGWVDAEAESLRGTAACRVAFPSGGRGAWKTGAFRIAAASGAALFAGVFAEGGAVAHLALVSVEERRAPGEECRGRARTLRDAALARVREMLRTHRCGAPGRLYNALHMLGAYGDEAFHN